LLKEYLPEILIDCYAQAERKRDSAPRGLILCAKWKLLIGHH
jgi:hypothetical protein